MFSSSWLRPKKICWMLEKDTLSWPEIPWDKSKRVLFISVVMIMSLFALDCFEMLSFSPPPTAQHSQNAHYSIMKNGELLLILSWLRKKSPSNLNNVVESAGVLSDFKVFLFPQACCTHLLLKSVTSNACGVINTWWALVGWRKSHWIWVGISGSGPGALPPLCLFHTTWSTLFEIHGLIQSLWWPPELGIITPIIWLGEPRFSSEAWLPNDRL